MLDAQCIELQQLLETKAMEYTELKEFTEEERTVRTEIMEQLETDFMAAQAELVQAEEVSWLELLCL